MIKIICSLKRKRGLTRQQFREYYESSHAVMAIKEQGHLMVGYRRNYLMDPMPRLTDPENERQVDDEGPDVITEICLRDQAALEEFGKIFNDPAKHQMFIDDEKRFLDRDASRWGICEIVENDTTKAPVFSYLK